MWVNSSALLSVSLLITIIKFSIIGFQKDKIELRQETRKSCTLSVPQVSRFLTWNFDLISDSSLIVATILSRRVAKVCGSLLSHSVSFRRCRSSTKRTIRCSIGMRSNIVTKLLKSSSWGACKQSAICWNDFEGPFVDFQESRTKIPNYDSGSKGICFSHQPNCFARTCFRCWNAHSWNGKNCSSLISAVTSFL